MEVMMKEFAIEEVESLEAPVSGRAVAGFAAGGASIAVVAGAAYLAC